MTKLSKLTQVTVPYYMLKVCQHILKLNTIHATSHTALYHCIYLRRRIRCDAQNRGGTGGRFCSWGGNRRPRRRPRPPQRRGMTPAPADGRAAARPPPPRPPGRAARRPWGCCVPRSRGSPRARFWRAVDIPVLISFCVSTYSITKHIN